MKVYAGGLKGTYSIGRGLSGFLPCKGIFAMLAWFGDMIKITEAHYPGFQNAPLKSNDYLLGLEKILMEKDEFYLSIK